MRHAFRTIAFSSALCLGLASGSALLAQDSSTSPAQDQSAQGPMQHGGMHGPMSPDKELAHMTKQLSLTSDQQSQIKPILEDRQSQMMQMHQDSSMSREDKMTKMKSLDDSSNSKVEAVLTDQQKPKYEKMIANRQQHMEQRRAEHQNGGAEPQSSGAQPQ